MSCTQLTLDSMSLSPFIRALKCTRLLIECAPWPAATMGGMATWEDGAEYAPIERPDGFAMPVAQPLEVEPPYRAATPGPGAPPAGFRSDVPAPALGQLGHTDQSARNPGQPFDVVGSVMTAETAWGAAHRDQSGFAQQQFDPWRPIELSGSVEQGGAASDAHMQLPPPSGQPVAPPQPMPSPGAPRVPGTSSAQRTIGWVSVGLLILAALLPTTTSLIWLVSGGLLLRSLPSKRGLGAGIMAGGVVQAALPYLLDPSNKCC